MLISLRTSATNREISVYNSPVVPRPGETISLVSAEPTGALFRVTDVRYQVLEAEQTSNAVHLEVMPMNEAACRYVGQTLYSAA